MDEELLSEVMDMIAKELSPLQAKVDILESELDRLHNRIVEMEKKLDEIDVWIDPHFDDIEAINDEQKEHSEDNPLLDHLLQEPKQAPVFLGNTPHLSLTIDLSKKTT